jgi:hypothetical protein
MVKKISDLERGFEEKSLAEALERRIKELELENMSYKKTLEEYGITEASPITDVELICIKGIENLKAIAEVGMLSKDDSMVLDVLHKNLRMARGQMEKKEPKGKAQSVDELLKIVDGGRK